MAGVRGTNINKKIDLTSKCPGSVIAARRGDTINIAGAAPGVCCWWWW